MTCFRPPRAPQNSRASSGSGADGSVPAVPTKPRKFKRTSHDGSSGQARGKDQARTPGKENAHTGVSVRVAEGDASHRGDETRGIASTDSRRPTIPQVESHIVAADLRAKIRAALNPLIEAAVEEILTSIDPNASSSTTSGHRSKRVEEIEVDDLTYQRAVTEARKRGWPIPPRRR